MKTNTFSFAKNNLLKVCFVPLYLLGMLLCWCVPRNTQAWVFASGAGFGEGAKELALALQARDPNAKITWVASSDAELLTAQEAGFEATHKHSVQGWWRTMTARYLVVTHGLGDVNRFAVFRARIIQLWHGAPIKKLHLDSPVTTQMRSGVFQRMLHRMYQFGARQVSLYVAGSHESAQRLRSAFRVEPGRVRVFGDPRLDELISQLGAPRTVASNETLAQTLKLTDVPATRKLVLFAPTWRDGETDPTVPTQEEAQQLQAWARAHDTVLCVRAHPLSVGAYEQMCDGEWVRPLSADVLTDITPHLHLFDTVITDYSSLAIDFALTGNPLVWFAPDLDTYRASRGLYEPYEMTTEGRWETTWAGVIATLTALADSGSAANRAARLRTQRLCARFHAHPSGGAADRVLDYVHIMENPRTLIDPARGVFFESYYGTRAACNPRALDTQLAKTHPHLQRVWSVAHEQVQVPPGAIPVLIGSPEWEFARKHLSLLIINDWSRLRRRRRAGQYVLQTWHGTPLKKLALDRADMTVRTRVAILRERARWSSLLTQNPHATQVLGRSYRMQGRIFETGYPRNDALALASTTTGRVEPAQHSAKKRLGLSDLTHVLLYAPTWRDHARTTADTLRVAELSEQLGPDWVILARGHSRDASFAHYAGARVVDVTGEPDITDVILAADVCITDYSSVMFDVTVAQVPLMFFVPDLRQYRDEARGFTFDMLQEAPGPLLTQQDEVVTHLRDFATHGTAASWCHTHREAYAKWRNTFNPHDDGRASERVIKLLESQTALPS